MKPTAKSIDTKTRHVTKPGANLFTEPYLLTAGGGPSGKSASPVLLMYQTGIEQNHPDFASALGVLLVLGVLVVVAVQRLLQRHQA